MHASAAATDLEPSVRTRPRSVPGDLWLVVLVAGTSVFDASSNLVNEIVVEQAVPIGGLSFLRRFVQLTLLGLLCIAPGALAARVVFRRFPTRHRDCLRIMALFIAGSIVGNWAAFHAFPIDFSPDGHRLPWSLFVQSVLSYVAGATAVVYAMYWWRRDTLIQQELHRARVGLLALKADRADAELLRLRAQIEPHFLFNTLATVMQLYRSDAASADRTLALLIDYMNASRVHMRDQETVLALELALAESFLAIQHLRMGDRLCHAIDIPHDFLGNRIPPASLLTLIENAIKHGLAPVPGGGMLRVAARCDGGWPAFGPRADAVWAWQTFALASRDSTETAHRCT